MKKVLVTIFIASSCFGLSAQNLQSILDKTSKAMGFNIRKNMPHLQTDGYFILRDSDAKIPFKMEQSKPDHLRIETSIFGFKAVQTYDGKTAWMLTPTQGMEARETDSRDMEFLAAATAIDGPFSVNKDNKYTLKYLGADTYLEQAVEKVMWTSEKERLKYYISTKDYTISGIRYEYQKNGGWYSMEYRILSYQDYKGTKFPEEISGVVNGVELISLFVTKVNQVDDLDPKIFGKPSYN